MTDAERLAKRMAEAEEKMRADLARLLPSREEQWRRISAMAGLDEDSNILPPPKKRKKAND